MTDNYNITYEDETLTVVPKPGDIDTEVKTGEDVPQTQVSGLTPTVAESVASEEEKARVKAGETLLLYLDIENIDDTVSDADKALVTAAATGQDAGAKIGMYLDMTLFKQIGNDPAKPVSELSTPLTVKIAIPELAGLLIAPIFDARREVIQGRPKSGCQAANRFRRAHHFAVLNMPLVDATIVFTIPRHIQGGSRMSPPFWSFPLVFNTPHAVQLERRTSDWSIAVWGCFLRRR